MVNKNDILNFLRRHLSELRDEYHIVRIGLIGSFARDEQNDSSDIDLVVEFEPGTENIYELKTRLKQYLKQNLDRDVDICREKYIKPYVRSHLENEAIYV